MPARLNDGETIERVRLRILVRGAVQGVGFRPFVHRQATALGLAGWVINSSAGVVVEAEGDPERIAGLVRNIREGPPANATVDSVETCAITARWDDGFEIRASDAAGACTVQVLPDFATCTDCLAELFDPTDRRYRYPFINCTHCGPRYSIIEDIPYDRALTSMRRFAMCPVCRAEYDNPADRRFHAEPNACADCGPRIALWNASGTALCHGNDVLIAAAAALRAGSIVAVKGIGGFHLVVDARDEAAVRLLRARKRRAEKPFAVMFPSLGRCRGELPCQAGRGSVADRAGTAHCPLAADGRAHCRRGGARQSLARGFAALRAAAPSADAGTRFPGGRHQRQHER